MKIKVKKPCSQEQEVVDCLRKRAAECVERHMSAPPRSDTCYGSDKPLDLWEAKLCLEVAQLFQATEE